MGQAKQPGAGVKATDNNKRLAMLEAGVSALAITIVQSGFTIAEGDDPLIVAGTIVQALAATNNSFAELFAARSFPANEGESCYGTAARLIDELEGKGSDAQEGATAGELAAIGRADAAEKRVGELEDQVKTLSEDLGNAGLALAKATGSALRKTRALARSSKARKIGPLKGGTDREALKLAMDDAVDPMQIVFSNGAAEIIELEPIEAFPPAFRVVQGDQYRLIDDVLVKGTRDGTRVRGIGLVMPDGRQIAYQEIEPVDLPAGQERKFQVQF